MKGDLPTSVLIFIIIGIFILFFLLIFYFHLYNPINNSISQYNNSTNNSLNQIQLESYCYTLTSKEQILENYLNSYPYCDTLINYTCNNIVFGYEYTITADMFGNILTIPTNIPTACYECLVYYNNSGTIGSEILYIDCRTHNVYNLNC